MEKQRFFDKGRPGRFSGRDFSPFDFPFDAFEFDDYDKNDAPTLVMLDPWVLKAQKIVEETIQTKLYITESYYDGQVQFDTDIKSEGYEAGVSGWLIEGNGDVYFNSGTFRGTVYAAAGEFTGSVTAASGEIGGWTIGAHSLSAGNMTLTDSGTITTDDFTVNGAGELTSTAGTIGGWTIGTHIRSAAVGSARIDLNPVDNRIEVWDDVQEKVAHGYLGGLPKYDGSGDWTSADYGYWIREGDRMVIDGDTEYTNGSWLVENDATIFIKAADDDSNVIRLGTMAGTKGLWVLEDNLGTVDFGAKLTSSEFFVGNSSQYVQWVDGAMTISGSLTVGTANGIDITDLSGTGALASLDTITSGSYIDDGVVEAAKLGTTIIEGGYIKTDLLTADNITTGTLDASVVTVSNLDADNITTGTLSADYISGGTISADLISGGTLSGDLIDGGTISGNLISGGTISGVTLSIGSGTFQVSSGGVITYNATQVELGNGADASGTYSVAIGNSAGGDGTASSGDYSVAVGDGADYATADYAVVVGRSASATANNTIAVGFIANADAANAIAIGRSADATATSSIALGYHAEATYEGAIAIGYYADATDTRAVALGHYAEASGDYAIAIGRSADAIANNTIAIGFSTYANATGAVAIGLDADATATGAVAIGSLADADEYAQFDINTNDLNLTAFYFISSNHESDVYDALYERLGFGTFQAIGTWDGDKVSGLTITELPAYDRVTLSTTSGKTFDSYKTTTDIGGILKLLVFY